MPANAKLALALVLVAIVAVSGGKQDKQSSVTGLPGLGGFLMPSVKVPNTEPDTSTSNTDHPLPHWFGKRWNQMIHDNGVTELMHGVRSLFTSLFTDDDNIDADGTLSAKYSPANRDSGAERRAAEKERSRSLPKLVQAHEPTARSLASTQPCSGIGIATVGTVNFTQYTCNGAPVAAPAYTSVKVLQSVTNSTGNSGTGVKVLLDVAGVLQGTGVSFSSLVSPNTGIYVNVSQLFSGPTLAQIETDLNITSPDQTVVDVGRLFQNDPSGQPIVNLTTLVEALPASTLAQVVNTVNCTSLVQQQTTSCLCPVNYQTNANCTKQRNFTCQINVLNDGYADCIATNGRGQPNLKHSRYTVKDDGDPPCLSFHRASSTDTLAIHYNITCHFIDGQGNYPRCNGTTINNAYVAAVAAFRNVTVAQLPGQPPYYDFHCLEQRFNYGIGSPQLNGAGVSLSTWDQSLTVNIRPYNLQHLFSDETYFQSVDVPLAAVSDPSWNSTITLPVGDMPYQYFPGGRLYMEVFVPTTSSHHNSSYKPPVPLRIIADNSDFVEGVRHSKHIDVIVGVTVSFGVVIAGAVYWYYQRKERLSEEREMEAIQTQVNTQGLRYVGLVNGGSPEAAAANKKRGAIAKKHGWF